MSGVKSGLNDSPAPRITFPSPNHDNPGMVPSNQGGRGGSGSRSGSSQPQGLFVSSGVTGAPRK